MLFLHTQKVNQEGLHDTIDYVGLCGRFLHSGMLVERMKDAAKERGWRSISMPRREGKVDKLIQNIDILPAGSASRLHGGEL